MSLAAEPWDYRLPLVYWVRDRRGGVRLGWARIRSAISGQTVRVEAASHRHVAPNEAGLELTETNGTTEGKRT